MAAASARSTRPTGLGPHEGDPAARMLRSSDHVELGRSSRPPRVAAAVGRTRVARYSANCLTTSRWSARTASCWYVVPTTSCQVVVFDQVPTGLAGGRRTTRGVGALAIPRHGRVDDVNNQPERRQLGSGRCRGGLDERASAVAQSRFALDRCRSGCRPRSRRSWARRARWAGAGACRPPGSRQRRLQSARMGQPQRPWSRPGSRRPDPRVRETIVVYVTRPDPSTSASSTRPWSPGTIEWTWPVSAYCSPRVKVGPVDAGGDGGVTEPGHPPCAIDPNRHVT